jgi:hypothetical protein
MKRWKNHSTGEWVDAICSTKCPYWWIDTLSRTRASPEGINHCYLFPSVGSYPGKPCYGIILKTSKDTYTRKAALTKYRYIVGKR